MRNARGGNQPDILQTARDLERFGGQGITVHPRPDQRHIRYSDLTPLKETVTTELNIEGNPTPDFIDKVLEVVPHQVTLVPDAPDALTSDAGWDTIHHAVFLTDVSAQFKAKGIRVSIFVDPHVEMIEAAAELGIDRIELYTEQYAKDYNTSNQQATTALYAACAARAHDLGLEVNAGHDLNLDNLTYFAEQLPILHEVSIGHALVADALYLGWQNTVNLYLQALNR